MDQEESHKLQAEKSALIETVKRLNRDVSKLEGFKRHLLQSLQEEEQVRPKELCKQRSLLHCLLVPVEMQLGRQDFIQNCAPKVGFPRELFAFNRSQSFLPLLC